MPRFSEQWALQNIYVFQKGRAYRSNNNVQYVENIVFFNLKLYKHIALHQTYRLKLFF